MLKFYIFLLIGVVWIAVGLRDIYGLGFLAQNGREVSDLRIAMNFFLGIFFLIIAWGLNRKRKSSV